jgi:hypothetical protein
VFQLKSKRKVNPVALVTAFLVLAVPVVLALIFMNAGMSALSFGRSIRVPLIRTDIITTSGDMKPVQARFSVKFDEADRQIADSIGTYELQAALQQILEDLDYDTMAGVNGVEYVNARMTEMLSERIGNTKGEVIVYLTDFETGGYVQLQGDRSVSNDLIDSLFTKP